MSVSVVKGGNTIITKNVSELSDVFISIRWRIKENIQFDPDINASLFLLNNNHKVRKDQDFIFYNNGIDENKSVVYISNENGAQDDNEGFIVHLHKILDDISTLAFTLTLHDWEQHQQDFKHILDTAIIRVNDHGNNDIIAEYNISFEDYNNETAIIFGELYRYADGWKFRAVGQGFAGGLKALAEHFGVSIAEDIPASQNAESASDVESKRTRCPRQQIIDEHKASIKIGIERFLPQINSAMNSHQNESNTRIIFDRILQDVFGYSIEEIKTEQVIQGRKADYIISADNRDMLVVEIKRVGMILRDKQVFQATAYGAYSGIKWALLTNLLSWQLYRISTAEKVEANLVFDVDLRNGLDNEAIHYLYVISRDGITRKGLLEQIWVRTSALTCESLITAILNEEVISKIRSILNRESGSRLTNKEVREALERRILQMD